ncbi:ABC transporter, permease protein, partial [Listeria ivanovii FSL F6-596]
CYFKRKRGKGSERTCGSWHYVKRMWLLNIQMQIMHEWKKLLSKQQKMGPMLQFYLKCGIPAMP